MLRATTGLLPPPPSYVTQGLEGKVNLALVLSKRQRPRASLFLTVHIGRTLQALRVPMPRLPVHALSIFIN